MFVKAMFPILALMWAAPVLAEPAALSLPIAEALETAPKGTRFGLLVVDDAGRDVLAFNPDQRFVPASVTKIVTTATAFAMTSANPDFNLNQGGTALFLRAAGKKAPDLVIRGEGGVSLSSAPDCTRRCLATLVERAIGTVRKVGDVIGDDSAFADQRWSLGMSWNNIGTDDGTATSALIVDDNELPITVASGTPGAPAAITLSPYFTLVNQTVTAASGETRIAVERPVNSRVVRVYGQIAIGARPWRDSLGIDDGAHYAAWAVRQVLRARGVVVTGTVRTQHRAAAHQDPPSLPIADPAAPVAAEPAVPIDEQVAAINKHSQNLHAEALLRRIGLLRDERDILGNPKLQVGSTQAGLAAVDAFLDGIGLPAEGYALSDGSGMSTYNRLSPRATVMLLRWIAGQPWGERWYATLPVAGVDGTLRWRFSGTALAGNLSAKTGALNATNALAGRLRAASGRMLTFAVFANDVPASGSAAPAIDAALARIAAAN